MIHYLDDFTGQQFKAWVRRALDAERLHHAARRESDIQFLKGDLDERHESNHRAETYEWGVNFLRIINRWQYVPNDSHHVIQIMASERDLAGDLVNEFSFVVRERAVDGALLQSDLTQGKVLYNGGLINHGSTEAPKWQTHT